MKLNIYENQTKIKKTFEVEGYDIMYGTMEDCLDILDGMEEIKDDMEIFKVISKHREKLNLLLLDVFSPDGMTKEDLRGVKVKELVPFFIELFSYVKNSFSDDNTKN